MRYSLTIQSSGYGSSNLYLQTYLCRSSYSRFTQNKNKMTNEAESFLGVRGENEPQPNENSSRYPALRVIAGIYRILAFLFGIAAIVVIIFGVRALDSSGAEVGAPLIIGGFLGGLIGVITNLAAAEGILVFLDIEQNTRSTNYAVRELSK